MMSLNHDMKKTATITPNRMNSIEIATTIPETIKKHFMFAIESRRSFWLYFLNGIKT